MNNPNLRFDIIYITNFQLSNDIHFGLKSIFETDFKRHSEPRLASTAQINH